MGIDREVSKTGDTEVIDNVYNRRGLNMVIMCSLNRTLVLNTYRHLAKLMA